MKLVVSFDPDQAAGSRLDAGVRSEIQAVVAAGNTPVTSASITDATAVGRSVLTAADAATARSAIGAGTSSLVLGTTSTTAKRGDYTPTWTEVTSKPATFPPSTHAHVIGDVTGLQTALDGKVGTNDSRLSDARTPTAHTHPITDITNLQSTLAGKVDTADPRLSDARTPTAHTHAIADVTSLQSTLDNKADKWNGAIANDYLYMSPESGKAIEIPYFMNDLAYNNLRGGATRLYKDGVLQSTNMDIVFEPTASARSLPTPDVTEYVVEVDLWRTFAYGTKVGIAVMESWRAKHIKIEAFDRGLNDWKLVHEDTNNPTGDLVVTVPGQGSAGINALRYTFRDFNSGASLRIGQLMLFNYSSDMGAAYFLPRNGGELYGNVSGVTPTSAEHLTRKDYVDSGLAGKVGTSDPRLSDARTPTAHTHSVADLSDSTALGRSLVTAADAATARGLLEITGSGSTAWADITGKPATFPPSPHSHLIDDVTGLQTALDSKVATDDSRLSDARTPLAHNHAVTDLTATGRTSANFLRGDGTWATPTNTTYSTPSTAEITAGSATTARTITADLLKQAVRYWTTGSLTTANTAFGQSLNTVADAAAARTLLGAGTSSLTLGTTSGTAKAGDYVPSWGEITSKPTAFTPAAHTHPATEISDSTATGRSLLTATDAAAARTAIGAGTSNLALGTTASTAKAGNYVPTWTEVTSKPSNFPPSTHSHVAADISDSTALGRSLLVAADASVARSAIGAMADSYTPAIADVNGLQTALDAKAVKASGTSGTGLPWDSEMIVNAGALASGYNDGIGGIMVAKPVVLEGMVFRIADPSKVIGGTGNLQIEWYWGATDALETTLLHTSQIAAGLRDVWVVLASPVNIPINACLRAKFTLGTTTVDGPCHVQWRGRFQ